MKKILVIGEVIVEIMADEQGDGFLEPIKLTGPYPSGAPAIFADQAARLGQPAVIVSAVGDDDFGRLNIERLRRDGVDVSAIRTDPDRPTGSAFVRYRADGSRDFVFNINHSACGRVSPTGTSQAVLERADHLHVMGSSLSSAEFVALNVDTAEAVKARGGTVSFDPNLRKEILSVPGMRDTMLRILALTDLYLPSGEELTLLTDADDVDGAVQELLSSGVQAIVHKKGAGGAQYHDSQTTLIAPAYAVQEIDPTGAGDCFGGAFTALWLRGADKGEALRVAAAAGALAVTKRGPMEGAASLDTLKSFVAQHRQAS